MSIRNSEQLYDAISEELVWRRKELHDLKSMAEAYNLASGKRSAILRSAVALLYAHWEGFIKAAGEAYLEFVAMQRLEYGQLKPNFIALAIKGKLNDASVSSRAAARNEVVSFFLEDLSKRSSLPHQGVILTSNLSSVVLRDIVDTLGLDYSGYATKEKLIDDRLLWLRNNIAHGNWMPIDVQQYIELHDQVLGMMQLFRNQIANAAVNKEYKV
jgi:hypothetical protein